MAAQVRMPSSAGDRAGNTSGEVRQHCHFVIEDVATLLADDFLAGPGVDLDRNGVAHRAAGHEDRGLPPEDLRGTRFQPVDGGIFAVNVVANLGVGHGAAHFRRGSRDRVAAEIGNRQSHGDGLSLANRPPAGPFAVELRSTGVRGHVRHVVSGAPCFRHSRARGNAETLRSRASGRVR